jgi:hypothetical protein
LEARLVLFDAAALRGALEETFRQFAAERFPEKPPERRALEAELSDIAAPLTASFEALDAAAAAVRESADDTRFAAWRDWTAAVHAVFAQADRCWLAALPVLSAGVQLGAQASRAGRGSLWRRLFRLIGGGRRGS